MLNKLTGAIRNLFHPATGDKVEVSQDLLKEEQTRARATGTRRADRKSVV